jgi:hypothetical protein
MIGADGDQFAFRGCAAEGWFGRFFGRDQGHTPLQSDLPGQWGHDSLRVQEMTAANGQLAGHFFSEEGARGWDGRLA